MLVSPTPITMTSALFVKTSSNPMCVIRNTSNTGSGGSLRIITNQNVESSIGFNTSSDANWVAGVGAYTSNAIDFGIGHN